MVVRDEVTCHVQKQKKLVDSISENSSRTHERRKWKLVLSIIKESMTFQFVSEYNRGAKLFNTEGPASPMIQSPSYIQYIEYV